MSLPRRNTRPTDDSSLEKASTIKQDYAYNIDGSANVRFVVVALLAAMFLSLPCTPGLAAEPDHPDTGQIARFVAQHWAPKPAAAVQDAPNWGVLERSLDPAKCGMCHPAQFADWTGSRHSKAMSPGLLMQLLDQPAANETCNNCHAPLIEQRPAALAPSDNTVYSEILRDTGVSCPACHVRSGQVHGPPRRDGSTGERGSAAHGGFNSHNAYEDSQFCSSCHQFPEAGFRMNGVLLENTWSEWREWNAEREPAEHTPCQGCHMPDRRHLWRGIHDPKMTASALTIRLESTQKRSASYSITNTGAGHYFPTYVTPRLTLIIEALDDKGTVLHSNSAVIQRKVDLYLREQPFDTRLAPGASAQVGVSWERGANVQRIAARIVVEPDEFYYRFFQLYQAQSEQTRALHSLALRDAESSKYVIGERSIAPGHKR